MGMGQETVNGIYRSHEQQHLTLLVLCSLAITIDETRCHILHMGLTYYIKENPGSGPQIDLQEKSVKSSLYTQMIQSHSLCTDFSISSSHLPAFHLHCCIQASTSIPRSISQLHLPDSYFFPWMNESFLIPIARLYVQCRRNTLITQDTA